MDETLREQVIFRDCGRCQWPRCWAPGKEIAHLHSKGMGGSKQRDTASNLMWLCEDHARISDGEYGSGGARQYLLEHLKLFGSRFLDMDESAIGWERAEALKELIR